MKKKIIHSKVPDVDCPKPGLCTVYIKKENGEVERQEWPRVKKRYGSSCVIGAMAKNNKCPHCFTEDNSEGEAIEAIENEVSQEIYCLNCKKTWIEVYKQPDSYK